MLEVYETMTVQNLKTKFYLNFVIVETQWQGKRVSTRRGSGEGDIGTKLN